MECICNLKVGDVVDWHRYSWRSHSHTTQRAFWHGEIVRDLGITTLGAQRGHVFEVRWTESNWWGKPFKKEPEGTEYTAVPPVHLQTEMCVELKICQGPGGRLHPRSLR